jgi:hypothetical protein
VDATVSSKCDLESLILLLLLLLLQVSFLLEVYGQLEEPDGLAGELRSNCGCHRCLLRSSDGVRVAVLSIHRSSAYYGPATVCVWQCALCEQFAAG